MPRRRQRFSDLERQFRDSGGVAEANSRLAGYIDFKKGVNKIEVKNKVSATDRKRYAFAILPFGLAVPAVPLAGDRFQAPITAYSNAGRTALSLSNAQCGYDTKDAATNPGDNFYPAIIRPVIVNASPTSGDLTPISGVTKKPYKRSFVGKSFGIPFGRTITGVDGSTLQTVTEEQVKFALATAAKSVVAANVRSISYLPEEFKSPKAELISPP